MRVEADQYFDADDQPLSAAEIEQRFGQQILEGTLVRRIEKRYLDVDAAHWQKNLTVTGEAGKPFSFITLAKQLPEPLPSDWAVEALNDSEVMVTVYDGCDLKVDSFRALPVKSAGQLPSGLEPGELYASRFHPRGLQLTIVAATDALRGSREVLETALAPAMEAAKAQAIQAQARAQAQLDAQRLATHKGELADTTATRDSDQVYLDDLVAECSQKSSDFESRQQLRTDELAAIDKAIEILSSGAVSGAADKHLPALLQKDVSFLQISASARNPTQARVAEFLRQKGSSINSRVLSALAVRVAEDPFVKVKKMIKDLIVRLMEEANEEAEHKGWCDTELSTNEQTRKEKTAAVETLHAEIDELSASK